MRKHLKNHFIPHKGNDYHPHSMKSQTLLFSLFLGIGILGLSFFSSKMVPGIAQLADVQSAYLVELTNEERSEREVAPLAVNLELQRAAELKLQDMVDYSYFAHVSPQGKNPWTWMNQAGYKYQYAGENLAVDFYDTKKVTQAWMNSPGHRKNILNDRYTDIGIAVGSGYYEGKKVAFVVQMFGTPREVVAPTFTQFETPTIASVPEPEANEQVLGEETVVVEEEAEVLAESFIETQYEAPTDSEEPVEEEISEPLLVIDQPQAEVSRTEKVFIDPLNVAEAAILVLIGLLVLSLILKVIIEIRKQHYKSITLALLVIVALALAYLLVAKTAAQVTII